jgi:NAD(P)-dependent dehydrogenase (short-subunit alcohol dehydrogenase family)
VPTVILTGATRGIGRAAALELARRGVELAIVGRDPARVDKTAAEAGAVANGTPIHRHVADLSQLDEVRRLAAELLDRHPRIDVLANNAGAMFTSRHLTDDGFEQTFALRYRPGRAYATSKLCNVLFTRELQRRRPDLAVNCFHPGVIRTGFGKNDGLLSRLSMTAIGPFLRSPERGAEGLVWRGRISRGDNATLPDLSVRVNDGI